ncbi:16134_t:CDS:2, partial [Gigaspora margarita]
CCKVFWLQHSPETYKVHLIQKIPTSGLKNFTCIEIPKSKSVRAKKVSRKVLVEVPVRVSVNVTVNVPANVTANISAIVPAKVSAKYKEPSVEELKTIHEDAKVMATHKATQ